MEDNTVENKIFVLICIFGISSWITLNGIFAQLSTYAETLPEKWEIGTDLGLIIQLSNIFPLIYFLLRKKLSCLRSYALINFILLIIILVSTILLIFCWNTTAVIFNKERSIGLLLLTFIGGSADCTSSLTYWPFITDSFKENYIPALATGEALSGTVGGLVGILQILIGFNITIYFLFIVLIICGSITSYLFLICSISKKNALNKEMANISLINAIDEIHIKNKKELCNEILFSLLIIFIVNFIQNGVYPSVLTYAFKDSENGMTSMKWAINITFCLTPFSAFMVKFENKILKNRVFQAFMFSTLSLCIILASLLGKLAVFKGSNIILILAYILSHLFFTYSKTMSFSTIKKENADYALTGGFITQTGSLLGSTLFYILINCTAIYS